jgi:hypothetical protein
MVIYDMLLELGIGHAHNVLSFRGVRLRQEQLVPGPSLQPRLSVPQLGSDRLPSRFLLRRSLIIHVHSLCQHLSLTWCRLLVVFVCPRFLLSLIPCVVALKYHLHIDIFKTNPTHADASAHVTHLLLAVPVYPQLHPKYHT